MRSCRRMQTGCVCYGGELPQLALEHWRRSRHESDSTMTAPCRGAGRALQSANAQLPSIPYFSAKVADNSCTTRVRASAGLVSWR